VATLLGMPSGLPLTPPTFGGSVTQRRFYWEVVVRPDEHVLAAPRRWTAQQQWRWGGLGFERIPVVSTESLSAWIVRAAAAEHLGRDEPLAGGEPPLAANRTVYSGVGSPGAASLLVVPTWFAVLTASGLALAAGLALAYLPRLRRPLIVVPVLGVVSLAAAASPDAAPLVMQAALPGILLALVAWSLRGWLDRDRSPSERPLVVASPSSLARAVTPPPSIVVAPAAADESSSMATAGRTVP